MSVKLALLVVKFSARLVAPPLVMAPLRIMPPLVTAAALILSVLAPAVPPVPPVIPPAKVRVLDVSLLVM